MPISHVQIKITGLILAGGQGQRMGGADKGLLPYQGKPLISYAIARLAQQVDTLLISANRNQAKYAESGCTVIGDGLPDYPGPLAGLQAGLNACETPMLVTIPCDTPNFPSDLVTRFRHTLAANPNAPLTWAEAIDGEHPVFMLCKKEILPALDSYLYKGGRRVRDFLKAMGGIPTHFDDVKAFHNLNTPDALRLEKPG